MTKQELKVEKRWVLIDKKTDEVLAMYFTKSDAEVSKQLIHKQSGS